MMKDQPARGATSRGATSEATRGSVRFGKTGWNVSPIGFGTYRVEAANETHRQALREALEKGCNLIDTSANYSDGDAERLVGDVLAESFTRSALRREQVVVVTKAGYIQGEMLRLTERREQEDRPFPEVTRLQPGCWHCISPEFLEDQITRSLARLRLEQLDLLLLHNPEYYLKSGGDHAEYYRRLEQAFRYLETEVRRGRIQYYGVSSNTFPEAREMDDYTSLETLVEMAAGLGPDHHFAAVEFPFNLHEPGAAFELNNTGKTVLELAHAHGLGTLINRPLNAYTGNQWVRLASEEKSKEPGSAGRTANSELAQRELQLTHLLKETMELEERLARSEGGSSEDIIWGHVLKKYLERPLDLDSWRSAQENRIFPTLGPALKRLRASEDADLRAWAETYGNVSMALFEVFTSYLMARNERNALRLSQVLVRACPPLASSPTLSRKALRVYRSVPGVDCILVGMRTPEYVRDALALEPPLTPEEAMDALEAVQYVKEKSHEG